MKIAFIGQKGIPARSGGVERHVEELATHVAARGHEVFAYVRNNYTDRNLREYKGVKLIHLPSIPTKNLDAISHTLLATLHALFSNYDVIHYHSIGPATVAPIIKLLKRSTALIGTYHSQDYYHQKWGWFARQYLRWGERTIATVPDRTVCVSKTLKQLVREKYGRESNFVPNGVAISPTVRSDELTRRGLVKKNYILTVTRLVRHKGVHYLIEAFQRLVRDGKIQKNFKLVIVGDGYFTDGYVKYLKNLAGKDDRIVFTGTLTGDPLSQIFSGAYAFVHPSESEGLSIVLLEALAYGIPTIASDIVENREVLEDARFVFRSRDVGDLQRKISWLAKHYEEVQEAIKNNSRRVKKMYDWERITDEIIELYGDAHNIKLLNRKGIYEKLH